MPTIRPSSDIRNNYQEISRLCKETGKPVYITVNGKGDTAIMDIEALDELYARLLEEGRVRTHEEVFSKFRGQ